MKTLCILGGSGFVGSHLVARLARPGREIRVPSRHPERARHLRVLPGVKVSQVDLFDSTRLTDITAGCDAVINLVAILNESRGADGKEFRHIHEELPKLVVDACHSNDISRLLHMSSLKSHPESGKSEYARSKGRGEQTALAADKLQVTSFRPSVIFGKGDKFLNLFATQLRMLPVMPVPCPEAKFAPVWVGDVVAAMLAALENPATYGQTYELCGPNVYTMQQLVQYVAGVIGVKRRIQPLSDKMSQRIAKFPFPPDFTMDNYQSLQVDNVCDGNDFERLGIQPHSLENIVPEYLGGAHSSRARYDGFRYQARRG